MTRDAMASERAALARQIDAARFSLSKLSIGDLVALIALEEAGPLTFGARLQLLLIEAIADAKRDMTEDET